MKKLLACILLLVSLSASAWEPKKPVTVLIGFKPGSGNEMSFRAVSAIVQKEHPEVNFIIELKPGADSVIASNALAEAKPDGYTIGIPSYMGTFVTNDLWQKDIKKFNHDSFTLVTSLGKSPLVFVANAASPVKTMSDLDKLIVEGTRPVNFAGGAGAHQMAYEFYVHTLLGKKTDRITYAVHQGPLQAVTSVAGDTGMEFGIMPIAVAWPLIQAGKVRALGITGTQSLKQLPDVKPIKVKDVSVNSYAAWAIALPPNTPDEIASWYRDAFVKALKSPEAAKFRDDNLIVLDEKELSSSGLKATLDGLRSVWLPFAQKLNLTGQ